MQEVDLSKLPKKERRRLQREIETEEMKKSSAMKRIRNLVIGLLFVGLLGIGGWFLTKELMKPPPGQSVADQGREHVEEAKWKTFAYNSNPPTSGPHDPVWTKPGVYTQPQGDGHLVHSLEHGYIVISYNCEMKSQMTNLKSQNDKEGIGAAALDEDCLKFVDKLKERVNGDLYKLILVPRPNLDTNFALTAWTRIDKFNTSDANLSRVDNFIKAFRNHGPEQTME